MFKKKEIEYEDEDADEEETDEVEEPNERRTERKDIHSKQSGKNVQPISKEEVGDLIQTHLSRITELFNLYRQLP